MRKNFFLCILLLITLLLPGIPFAGASAHAAPAALLDWSWLLAEVDKGKAVITLPNSMTRPEDAAGLAPEGTVRIEGNGYTLSEATIEGGTVVFKDVHLTGRHGVREESGGDALVLYGDKTIAVLMGTTRAEGGRSGPDGESGGAGVRLTGYRQGLILNDNTAATGGIGRLFGGAGVQVDGCEDSVLITDNAAFFGSPGLAEGGAGISVPGCVKVTFSAQSTATGGASPYTGGDGIHSHVCPVCAFQGLVSLSGTPMSIGGAGQDGGHGLQITRNSRNAIADLAFGEGSPMIMGGDGSLGGSALHASVVTIDYGEGGAQFFGGQYYDDEAPAMSLFGCEVLGDDSGITVVEGTQTQRYPASGVSSIISTAINQQSDRYTPEIIEDGLATRELFTKYNGLSVERGTVSQARINDGGLLITMYAGDLQKRMHYQQWFMDDGADGIRYVLIAAMSTEWPTIECSVGALRKMETLGITQLAYTCIPPVYHERVLDIAALLEAIDADENPVAKVMCGTADDAVIFIYEDGARDYQEALMPEIIRPL